MSGSCGSGGRLITRPTVEGYLYNEEGVDGTGEPPPSITEGRLYPYVNNWRLYHCPQPLRNWWNSYSINDSLAGDETISDALPTFGSIHRPSGMRAFCEEDDPRNFNVNSWIVHPSWENPNRNWQDYLSPNHLEGSTFVFADGHEEYWRWTDPFIFSVPKNSSAGGGYFGMTGPFSDDWYRVERIYSQQVRAYDDGN